LPALRLFSSNGRLISIDEQAIALATALAAFTPFVQACAATSLARRW
jgi:hypothetical protein